MSEPKGFRSLRAFHMAGEEGFEPSVCGSEVLFACLQAAGNRPPLPDGHPDLYGGVVDRVAVIVIDQFAVFFRIKV